MSHMPPEPADVQGLELPEEFRFATPIQRFHRFAILEHGEHAFFGLLGVDGKNNYFQCPREVITGLAMEFGGMAGHMEGLSKGAPHQPQLVPFYTTMMTAAAMHGGEANAHVMLTFFTPGGEGLTTTICPELAVTLEQSLKQALDTLPHRPSPIDPFNTYTPGPEPESGRTSEYFGQSYPTAILESLGVLMVRANLLDRSLVQLFAKLSGLSNEKAEAVFFSSRNNTARISMIRALLPTVELRDETKQQIDKALAKARSVMDQRNDLVHGEWKFKDSKMVVELFTPTAEKSERRNQVISITPKYIESIASEYRGATLMVAAASHYTK